MTDLASKMERAIINHRLPALQEALPAGEFVMPHYDGFSIANLPATTAALLGIEAPGVPLPREVWAPFAGGVRCVLRVIIDALGYRRLRQHMAAQADNLFDRLLKQGGQLIPLTSVCPSTTTTALSTLWTGHLPLAHGLLGTRLFLRDRGLRANMIYFTPVGFERRGILIDEGLQPAELLPVPGLAETFAKQGVETHVFINKLFRDGGLSNLFFRGVKAVHTFVPGSGADLWIRLRDFMERHKRERLFVSVYWGLIDGLAHERGPSSPAVDGELRHWTTLMREEFLEPLSPAAAHGTVLTIVADHGQTDTPPEKAVRLKQHPDLFRDMLMRPLGEQRFAYLFAQQGRTESVRSYIEDHLGQAFTVLDSQQAVGAGLFGPRTPTAETAALLGDFILVSRGNRILFDEDRDPHLLGLHGGLSVEEMLVPLMLARLDL
jgi:hypothetical protein